MFCRQVLEFFFSAVTFRAPHDRQTGALPQGNAGPLGGGPGGGGAHLHDIDGLSPDTLGARRRGAAALVLICKRVPGKLLPCLHDLCRKVIALAREGQLLWSEQALMYEMLVLVRHVSARFCHQHSSPSSQMAPMPPRPPRPCAETFVGF